jgi:hypothetical protein
MECTIHFEEEKELSQLQVIYKVIMDQNEIEQTNDLVQLAHCGGTLSSIS